MATSTFQAPMPQIEIVEGMILKLEAIDASTGLDVAGVTVTQWSIFGQGAEGIEESLEIGPVSWVWGSQGG